MTRFASRFFPPMYDSGPAMSSENEFGPCQLSCTSTQAHIEAFVQFNGLEEKEKVGDVARRAR
jgi:hypothetical protein